MGVIAGIALLLGLSLYEAFRQRASPRMILDAEEPIVLRRLCRTVTLAYDPGLTRGAPDEVATGDPEFDRLFRVRGREDVARALLDVGTRGALVALLTGSLPVRDLVMRDGELFVQPPRSVAPGGWQQLKWGVAVLAAPLAMPSDVARRLAETLLSERVPAARPLQLGALAGRHPAHPATLLAVREAARDDDPEMRLIGARALGPEGRNVLLALARDGAVDASVAARAIAAPETQLPALEACALLAATLAAAEGGGAPAPAGLPRKEVALACLSLLVRSGEPAAQRALIEALACSDEDVCADAAVALGVMGTAAAVAPLQDLAHRHRGALRRAAQQAVGAIQSRVSGARGDVSLPGMQGGEVALSTDTGGEVSLPATARTRPAGD